MAGGVIIRRGMTGWAASLRLRVIPLEFAFGEKSFFWGCQSLRQGGQDCSGLSAAGNTRRKKTVVLHLLSGPVTRDVVSGRRFQCTTRDGFGRSPFRVIDLFAECRTVDCRCAFGEQPKMNRWPRGATRGGRDAEDPT